MRIKLVERLKARYDDMVHTTFGYIPRIGRTAAGLPKDHNTDARAISGNAGARLDDAVWSIAKHRCHNRRLHREVPAKSRQSRPKSRKRTPTVKYNTHDPRRCIRICAGSFHGVGADAPVRPAESTDFTESRGKFVTFQGRPMMLRQAKIT